MDAHNINITVIVPTYKPGSYLWECLNSLCKQTFPHDHFEVLLVLNGCKEPYYSEIKAFISTVPDASIKLLQTDIGGVSNARNIGLDNASGEYITFIDDDDFVSQSYLEELYENATKEKVSLCYPLSFEDGTTDYTPYYITKDYHYEKSKEWHYLKAKKYFSGPVYKLIHREIIGNRRFDKRIANGEDSVFMFLISDRLEKVVFTSKNAVYYRRVRNGSALTKKKSISEITKNCLILLLSYSSIFLRRPFDYNFVFYITRLIATAHGFIEQLQIRYK